MLRHYPCDCHRTDVTSGVGRHAEGCAGPGSLDSNMRTNKSPKSSIDLGPLPVQFPGFLCWCAGVNPTLGSIPHATCSS